MHSTQRISHQISFSVLRHEDLIFSKSLKILNLYMTNIFSPQTVIIFPPFILPVPATGTEILFVSHFTCYYAFCGCIRHHRILLMHSVFESTGNDIVPTFKYWKSNSKRSTESERWIRISSSTITLIGMVSVMSKW